MKKLIAVVMLIVTIFSFAVVSFAFDLRYYTPNLNLYDTLGNIDTSEFTAEEKAFFTEWLNNRYSSNKYVAFFVSRMTLAADNTSGQNEYLYDIIFARLNKIGCLYLENAASYPTYGKAFPYILRSREPFDYISVAFKSSTSPQKPNAVYSFVQPVVRGVGKFDTTSFFYLSEFLCGLSNYSDYTFIPEAQSGYKNKTVVNLLIDNKTVAPPVPPKPSSSSQPATDILKPMPIPVIPKSDNPWVFYDTSVWNEFLAMIKQAANVAIKAGIKLFWFIVAVIFIYSIFRMVREIIQHGGADK